jgi:hypothetical protein
MPYSVQDAFLLWIFLMQNNFEICKEVTEIASYKKMEEHF